MGFENILFIANKQNPSASSIQPGVPLDADEQHLLDAIHAHPNKRDLVLNLLRQMNETSSHDSLRQRSTNSDPHRHPQTKME